MSQRAVSRVLGLYEKLNTELESEIKKHSRTWVRGDMYCSVSWENYDLGNRGFHWHLRLGHGNPCYGPSGLSADDLDWIASKRRAYERWASGEGELPPSELPDQ